jgi:hypothetical protein
MGNELPLDEHIKDCLKGPSRAVEDDDRTHRAGE